MRRRLVWIVSGTLAGLIAVPATAALSIPTTRHFISAFWNLPDRLPSLPDSAQVHYQAGAAEFARNVAALLPEAVARVEAVHGRPFAHPATIGAYATPAAYAAANGLGSDVPVGVTFAGRVYLSPKLFHPQPERLRAILTHELSHSHLAGWLGSKAVYLPNWFREGLAVMISEGGGAEFATERDARAAIRRGERITIDEADSVRSLGELRFDKQPTKSAPSWYPTVLAYRQAGMFVTYLRTSDQDGFNRMMTAILDGRTFTEAVDAGYHDNIRSLWTRFATSISSGTEGATK